MESQEPTTAPDGSIFNHTLVEVQSQLDSLGEPLSDTNLEVCAADSNKELGTENVGKAISDNGQLPAASVTLSKHLGDKTVDEMWRNIQQGHTENNCEDRTASRHQPTPGELTLEDFLAKAGIVADAPTVQGNNQNICINAHNSLPKPAWLQVQQHPVIQQPVPMVECNNMVPVFLPGNNHYAHQSLPIAITYPQTQTSLSSPQSAGTMSDTSSVVRKRVVMGDIIDKPAERRHKRMIKNRESAARSRERKQAYTQQLELKVAELEEENKKLKANDLQAPSAPPLDTKHQLRSTSSAPL